MTEFKASRKIGIKLLDHEQLKNVFPQYDNLLKHIQFQRERAIFQNASNQDSKKLIEHEYYLMHDNIFGIFGGRGSGKTSVLFSLREAFLRQSQTFGDIVLPTIMPEIISSECSLLGWVLAIFGDVVGEIECELKQNPHVFNNQEFMRKSDINFFENCRYNQQNKLREEYDMIYRECFSSTSSISGQYSFVDTVSIKADQSRKQYQLLKRLNKFWNLLVNTKYQMKLFETKCGSKEFRPLIFIMFDDIDLAPERSVELLTSAFKFFSNPNAVIIISAAMKTLEHVLICKMYEKVVGSQYPSLLQGFMPVMQSGREVAGLYQMDDAKNAALEYLNKVIPPSSRYFLERYDTCEQKLLFRYSGEWAEYHPDDITSKPIIKFLADLVMSFEGASGKNFLLKDKNRPVEEENFITTYLLIFGNKNRNIFNGCLEIMNVLEKLKDIKAKTNPSEYDVNDYREIYYVLNHLLTVLITSNVRNILEYQEYISSLFLLRKGEWNLYINYALLLEIYEKKKFAIEREIEGKYKKRPTNMSYASWEYLEYEEMREQLFTVKKSIGIMFVTLFFIENLLRVMFPGRGSIHGYWEITEFLNKDIVGVRYYENISNKQLKLFQSKKSVENIISAYALVLENPRPFTYFNIFNLSNINTYFTNVYYDDRQKEELKPDKLAESCTKDYYWSKTILSLLFISKSGLLLVNKDYKLKYDQFLELLIWWEFGDVLEARISQAFTGFLNQNHILADSNEKIAQIKKILDKKDETHTERVVSDRREKKSFETLFRDFNLSKSRDMILQGQCRKLWEQFKNKHYPQEKPEERDSQDFIRKIISFTEYVIELCRIAFFKNDFVVIVDSPQRENVEKWIYELMDVSPDVEEQGIKLINQFDIKGEDLKEQKIFIKFTDFFLFMTEIRNSFKKFRSASSEVYAIDESYFPFLPELIKYCPVHEPFGETGQWKEERVFRLSELALNLHLLNYLVPFYFAAEVIIENSRQYYSLQIRSQSEQSDQHHQDSFADIYQEIINYVETPNNIGNSLTQTFRQAKEDVVNDYLRKIEGGYE